MEDISWSTEQPWVETQVITNLEVTDVGNVDDDLARELAFYNQVPHNSVQHLSARKKQRPVAAYCICMFPSS